MPAILSSDKTYDTVASVTLDCMIDWATPSEREYVIEKNRKEGRQVMNLVEHPKSRLAILKTLSGQIVGWCGIDLESRPSHPESFSCYIEPAYRNYLLWLVLEHARCSFAKQNGFTHLYVRMNVNATADLMDRRLESKIYFESSAEVLDKTYLSECYSCDLFQNKCQKQIFLTVDIDRMLEHIERRMGPMASPLPRFVRLEKQRLRKKEDDPVFIPTWAEPLPDKKRA